MIRKLSKWAAAALAAAGPALAQGPPAAPASMPSPAPTLTQASSVPPSSPCDGCAADEKKPFADVPPVQPFPRPGYFGVAPSGPGYYSLLDQIRDDYREKPPKYPYPRVGLMQNSFFDVDWRYLDDPNNTEHDFFDCLKRQKFGDNIMFTTGGDLRYRGVSESNSRLFNGVLNGVPVGGAGRENNYDLTRVRVYGDLWITDNFRLFAEYFDAQSFNHDLTPLPIDRDWGDLLNAFIDVRTLSVADHPVWVRAGRQELLYGSQRLISPLEWANTRRTFEGVKGFWQGDKLAVDAFLVRPVIPNQREFDTVDQDVVLSGLWATYRPNKTQAVDGYVLNIDRANNAQIGKNGFAGGGNVTTVGGRYVGAECGWLWDVEGMAQFGTHANQSLNAYAATVAGGYHFKDWYAGPTFWVIYDYASGDPSPGVGDTRRTFDQLFPFGHYYLGYLDVVGRRNIHDINLAMTLYPTNWMTVTTLYHNFYLDRSRDALYNAAGLPTRQDATGQSGRHVGQEVDLLVNFHLTAHQDLLIGYSYLFAGEFIRNTAANPAARQNPDLLYVQYTYRW